MSLVETGKRELAGPDAVNELYWLLLKQWNGVDDLIAATREKVRTRRLEIGRTLLGLQQLIDSGENDDQCVFWDWFDEMVPGRSRSDARDLMHTARQPDAEVTYQKKLDKQREYNDRYYRKKLAAPAADCSPEINQPPPSPEAEQSETSSEGTTDQAPAEPEFFPPPRKPKKRFPSAEGDDALLDDLENVFRQLSWNGRAEGIKRLKHLYSRWRVGEQ